MGMSKFAVRSSAALVAGICLTACITQREQVLAPDASGIVIFAGDDQPVDGAQVRYVGAEGLASAVTRPDGSFKLQGLTEKRTIVAMPMGGVFRDSTLVKVSAPGLADAYASAAFINGGQAAQALYRVVVLMFPADAPDTPLHSLMRDCIAVPEQDHALHLAGYVAAIDPENPPDWFDENTAEAISEHLRLALPSSAFLPCEQMSEAYEMFRAQTEPLRTLENTAFYQAVPIEFRPSAEAGSQ